MWETRSQVMMSIGLSRSRLLVSPLIQDISFSSQIVLILLQLVQLAKRGRFPILMVCMARDFNNIQESNDRYPASPHDINGGNPLTLAVFSCSQYQAGAFAHSIYSSIS